MRRVTTILFSLLFARFSPVGILHRLTRSSCERCSWLRGFLLGAMGFWSARELSLLAIFCFFLAVLGCVVLNVTVLARASKDSHD